MKKIFLLLSALFFLGLCFCPGKAKNPPPVSNSPEIAPDESPPPATPAESTLPERTGVMQAKEVSFCRDVLPLLKRLAGDCHTADNMAGEYSLDSYEAVMAAGTDSIPNVVPGKPESSLLYIYLEKGHPFNKKPDSASLNIIRTWILQGAKNN